MRIGELTGLAADLLTAAGVPADRANRTARILLLSEAWGNPSHGLLRLPYYLARLSAGGCRADAELTLRADAPAAIVYDGESGLGHWQVWQAAETARDRCRTTGVAVATIADSSHCGALGAYVYPMVEAGQLGIVFSNGPAVMPPWGGAIPLLSTSPIAAGIPTGRAPMIVDMATTTVARGKVAAYAARGRELPEGWALDTDGTPTTDAAAGLRGMLAPLGGAKGYVLALLVEALTGGLTGPNLAVDVPDMFDPDDDARPQGISHTVLAIDPSVLGADTASRRFDGLRDLVGRHGGRVPGAARVAPGDLDDDLDLTIADETMSRLMEWAGELGVAASRA
ncbi:Ldh family oxidoreductase [Actinoallomurus sp. NBC_01490]|uniref:Ldh family oxidoreductase n=1 Tax=Actinoallomurus sp. NBC_01490 TaxID=2903557 RepID=UPI002E303473|nr:Ldh family oxidoreductase [Actinoallomurus sp. NBC_01490]